MTNLEYRARERQRKRESRRQASETQQEKGRQRSRARDKKQRSHFFVRGDQCKEKMSSSEKKVNKNAYDVYSIKKFLEVSHCSRAKQRQRNVQKSVLNVQSFFFFLLIRPIVVFHHSPALPSPFSNYTILYFVWTNYKYYRELCF